MFEQYVSGSFQRLPIPIILVGKDGIILEADKTFLELLTCSAADIVGRPLAEISDDPSKVAQLHDRTLRIGPVKGRECSLRDRNGIEIPVSISTLPRRNEQGLTTGYLAAIFDLRSVKRGEAELRASEERFRQVTGNSRQWIWEIDAQGQFTYVSPTVNEILGYEPTQLVGRKRFCDLYDLSEQDPLKSIILKIFNGKQPFAEHTAAATHQDGHIVWLALSGVPVHSTMGEVTGWRGSATDISERYEVERKSRRQNAVLRAIRDAGKILLRERDVPRLLKQVCDALVNSHSYESAWVVAFEPRPVNPRPDVTSPKLAATAETGLGKALGGLLDDIRNGRLPACIQRALSQGDSGEPTGTPDQSRWEPVIIGSPANECPNCSARQAHPGGCNMIARLAQDATVYGVFGVSLPNSVPAEVEERGLFAELAADISYVLHRLSAPHLLPLDACGIENALQAAEGQLKQETEARRQAEQSLLRSLGELEQAQEALKAAEAHRQEETAARSQAEEALRAAHSSGQSGRSELQAQLAREMAARVQAERKLQEAAAQNSELETRNSKLETGGADALRLAEDRLQQEIAAHRLTELALQQNGQELQKLRDTLNRIQATQPAVEQRLAQEISAREQAGQALRETREELGQTQQILQEMEGNLAKETAARHGAEETLRRNEELLSALHETMAARDQAESVQPLTVSTPSPMLIVLDREGRFRFQHATADTSVTLSAGEILGRKYTEALPAHVSPLMARAIERNQHQEPAEFEYPVATGKLVWWFQAHLTPIVLNGEYAGSFVEIRDISERKRREKEHELKRLNLELRQRVTDLEAAMKQLEAFSRGVAVETRGPGDITEAERAAGTAASVPDSVPGTAPAERESPAPPFPLLSPGDYTAAIPADTLQQLAHARRNVQDTQRLIDDLLTPSHVAESSPAPETPEAKPN